MTGSPQAISRQHNDYARNVDTTSDFLLTPSASADAEKKNAVLKAYLEPYPISRCKQAVSYGLLVLIAICAQGPQGEQTRELLDDASIPRYTPLVFMTWSLASIPMVFFSTLASVDTLRMLQRTPDIVWEVMKQSKKRLLVVFLSMFVSVFLAAEANLTLGLPMPMYWLSLVFAGMSSLLTNSNYFVLRQGRVQEELAELMQSQRKTDQESQVQSLVPVEKGGYFQAFIANKDLLYAQPDKVQDGRVRIPRWKQVIKYLSYLSALTYLASGMRGFCWYLRGMPDVERCDISSADMSSDGALFVFGALLMGIPSITINALMAAKSFFSMLREWQLSQQDPAMMRRILRVGAGVLTIYSVAYRAAISLKNPIFDHPVVKLLQMALSMFTAPMIFYSLYKVLRKLAYWLQTACGHQPATYNALASGGDFMRELLAKVPAGVLGWITSGAQLTLFAAPLSPPRSPSNGSDNGSESSLEWLDDSTSRGTSNRSLDPANELS